MRQFKFPLAEMRTTIFMIRSDHSIRFLRDRGFRGIGLRLLLRQPVPMPSPRRPFHRDAIRPSHVHRLGREVGVVDIVFNLLTLRARVNASTVSRDHRSYFHFEIAKRQGPLRAGCAGWCFRSSLTSHTDRNPAHEIPV